MSSFPQYRPRRLRRTETLRRLVRETTVSVDDLILPLFATPGSKFRKPIGSMPGVAQTSPDELLRDAAEAAELGVPAIILFGLPEFKDETGSSGEDPNGPVQKAVGLVKKEIPELIVMTDVWEITPENFRHVCHPYPLRGMAAMNACVPSLPRGSTAGSAPQTQPGTVFHKTIPAWGRRQRRTTVSYSYRSATSGSIPVALRAGT